MRQTRHRVHHAPLSAGDIRYPDATSIVRNGERHELGGLEFLVLPKLPAEVGSLFVAEFDGDRFDGFTAPEHVLSGLDALFIQPFLGGLGELIQKNPLQLARRNAGQLGQSRRAVTRLGGARLPLFFS